MQEQQNVRHVKNAKEVDNVERLLTVLLKIMTKQNKYIFIFLF